MTWLRQAAECRRLAWEPQVGEVGVRRAHVPNPDRIVEVEDDGHTGPRHEAFGDRGPNKRPLAEDVDADQSDRTRREPPKPVTERRSTPIAFLVTRPGRCSRRDQILGCKR